MLLVEMYCRDKMCVYDKHPLACRDTIPSNQELVEYQAAKSWLEYSMTQQARTGQNIQPMAQSGKEDSIWESYHVL